MEKMCLEILLCSGFLARKPAMLLILLSHKVGLGAIVRRGMLTELFTVTYLRILYTYPSYLRVPFVCTKCMKPTDTFPRNHRLNKSCMHTFAPKKFHRFARFVTMGYRL